MHFSNKYFTISVFTFALIFGFSPMASSQSLIEIESISPLGDWKLQTFKSGYSGSGYFYWDGPNKYGAPPTNSTLIYTFTLTQAGTYRIDFRGRRDQEGPCVGAASDECNDVYSKVDDLEWEKTMMKGPWGNWHWQGAIDAHNVGVINADYDLSAGTHTLQVTGRSEGVILDAIAIYLKGTSRPGDNTVYPSNIEDLTALVAECNVLLTWSDVDDEMGYRVRRKAEGESAYTNIADVNENVTDYTDESVIAGTNYTYMVRPLVNGTAAAVSNTPSVSVSSECASNTGIDTDLCPWYSPSGIWQGKGRIVISSDGNEHDHDDWSATPFSLALLASKSLQDQLALYTFSDHVWGSNIDHANAADEMKISALEGKEIFGFSNTKFIEAVVNPDVAYQAMIDEINKSTEEDPLYIIAAGPMQVVGTGLEMANAEKLKYVTIISHSNWNNKHSDNPTSNEPTHSGWTWDEIESTFKTQGLKMHFIVDQNGGSGYDGMRAIQSSFDWIKTSTFRSDPFYKPGSWDWLYSRQEKVIKNGEFDASDAGMIIYLLLGIDHTNPSDAKYLMENPINNCIDNENEVVDEETTITDTKQTLDELKIFPNPVYGSVSLSAQVDWILQDITGSEIESGSEQIIDVSNLPCGIYLIVCKQKTLRFIKK